jgi:acetyl esterase
MNKPFVRPDVQAFLDLMKANPRPRLTSENIAQMRELAPKGMAMLDLPVGELAVIRDLTVPGPGGDIPLCLIDAKARREDGPNDDPGKARMSTPSKLP